MGHEQLHQALDVLPALLVVVVESTRHCTQDADERTALGMTIPWHLNEDRYQHSLDQNGMLCRIVCKEHPPWFIDGCTAHLEVRTHPRDHTLRTYCSMWSAEPRDAADGVSSLGYPAITAASVGTSCLEGATCEGCTEVR